MKKITKKLKDWFNVSDIEKMHGVQWPDLVEHEPELERLLRLATMVGDACQSYADEERGWTQFKEPIANLVGFFGKNKGHPILGTRGAYDVVYWRLHNALVGDEPKQI
jgi:hypothetical protein